ncbi:hypothetical protein JW948_13510 [bacterium]|nr:hypothetical protein [bacterium]
MTSKDKTYTPYDTYLRGETIYHPIFKDTGKVKKVIPTVNHMQKIWVNFDKCGPKVLIASCEKPDNNGKEQQ